MRSRRRADKETKHGCSARQIFNVSLRCSAMIFSCGRKIHPHLQTNTSNWLNRVQDEPEVRGRSCAKSTCNMHGFKLNICRLLFPCWSLLGSAEHCWSVCLSAVLCVSILCKTRRVVQKLHFRLKYGIVCYFDSSSRCKDNKKWLNQVRYHVLHQKMGFKKHNKYSNRQLDWKDLTYIHYFTDMLFSSCPESHLR